MRFILISVLSLMITACISGDTTPVTNQNNALTQGNVELNISVGETTKAEVLDVFGAPNITTIDGNGYQVWTYQRHATVAQTASKSNAWFIILAGGSNSASGFERSSRTMTLIIKFDDSDIVTDFKSRASSF